MSTWGRCEEPLTADQASAVAGCGLVDVEVGPHGTYRLVGRTRVGVAVGRDWELHVTSHLSAGEVLFLLGYAADPSGWGAQIAHFAKTMDLLAAVGWGFVGVSERALAAGPLRGYRRLDERSVVLRGRLDVAASAARGGLPAPVDIVRDEYDVDVHENRLVVAAARWLLLSPHLHPQLRRRLRRLLNRLDGVSQLRTIAEEQAPPLNRLNRHYGPALVLAELIMRGSGTSARAGAIQSTTFAFELHRVFEQFLHVALGRSLAGRGLSLALHRHSTLDKGGALGLIPDFTVLRGTSVVAVLDAKFKRLGTDLGSDAYQMLSYLLEFDAHRGLLIAADGAGGDYEIRAVPKQIGVRPLRLDCTPSQILAQVDSLAAEIDGGSSP